MKKIYCDICGKEIKPTAVGLSRPTDQWTRYKLKKEHWSFGEHWWVNLDVHDECWEKLCKIVCGEKEDDK